MTYIDNWHDHESIIKFTINFPILLVYLHFMCICFLYIICCMASFSLFICLYSILYIHTYSYIYKFNWLSSYNCYLYAVYFRADLLVLVNQWGDSSLGDYFILFSVFLSCLQFLVYGWGLLRFPPFVLACLLVSIPDWVLFKESCCWDAISVTSWHF